MSECLFCRIACHAEPAKVLCEDAQTIVFEDINPQAPVHLLVVPRSHIARLSESTEAHAGLLGHLQRVAVRVAAELNLTSFRLVTNNGRDAHQTVDHLHYHLLAGRTMRWPPG